MIMQLTQNIPKFKFNCSSEPQWIDKQKGGGQGSSRPSFGKRAYTKRGQRYSGGHSCGTERIKVGAEDPYSARIIY